MGWVEHLFFAIKLNKRTQSIERNKICVHFFSFYSLYLKPISISNNAGEVIPFRNPMEKSKKVCSVDKLNL